MKMDKELLNYIGRYNNVDIATMTKEYNELSIKNRKLFLEYLDDSKDAFIKRIRKQAVKDFWTHEKELIKQGLCTRDWRNVQALDYTEHYEGAHDHHKTQISAKGFYNVETGETKIIAIPSEDEFKESKVIFIKNHMTTMSYLRKVN